MTTDNDNLDSQYQEFILLHVGELREKALVAVGTPCPACSEALKMASFMPWLICSNNHRIRPWTEKELEAMENSNANVLGA